MSNDGTSRMIQPDYYYRAHELVYLLKNNEMNTAVVGRYPVRRILKNETVRFVVMLYGMLMILGFGLAAIIKLGSFLESISNIK